MRVVAHLNLPGEGTTKAKHVYENVHGDPVMNPAGIILRNVNGGLIAILPWTSLLALELPENDTNLVALPPGITSALATLSK